MDPRTIGQQIIWSFGEQYEIDIRTRVCAPIGVRAHQDQRPHLRPSSSPGRHAFEQCIDRHHHCLLVFINHEGLKNHEALLVFEPFVPFAPFVPFVVQPSASRRNST